MSEAKIAAAAHTMLRWREQITFHGGWVDRGHAHTVGVYPHEGTDLPMSAMGYNSARLATVDSTGLNMCVPWGTSPAAFWRCADALCRAFEVPNLFHVESRQHVVFDGRRLQRNEIVQVIGPLGILSIPSPTVEDIKRGKPTDIPLPRRPRRDPGVAARENTQAV